MPDALQLVGNVNCYRCFSLQMRLILKFQSSGINVLSDQKPTAEYIAEDDEDEVLVLWWIDSVALIGQS